jgi:hypothetical protein
MSKSLLSIAVAALLGGCSLIPDYQQPGAVAVSTRRAGVFAGPGAWRPPPNRAGSSFSMTRPCSS